MLIPAVLMVLAPAPVQPRPIDYLPVGGPRADMLRQVEPRLATLPGLLARPARLEAAAAQACIDDSASSDQIGLCIRSLLPERTRGAPVVALWIDVQGVSNVTGSVRFPRYTLRCVGARSSASAHLGDGERWRRMPASNGRQEELRACLDKAATPRHAERLHHEAQAPRWRLPIARYLPDSAADARARCCDRAIVTVEQVRRTAARDGTCLLRVRVVEVESFTMLRRGDRVEVVPACSGETPAAFRRVLAPDGLQPGARARLYVNLDGEAAFVEPL